MRFPKGRGGAYLAGLTIFYVCGLAAALLVDARQGDAAPVAGLWMMVFGVVGLVATLRGSRRRDEQRRAWRLVSVSFLFLLATLVLFIIPGGKTTFPAPADVTRLCFVIALITASYSFPVATSSLVERRTSTFDALTVVAGASMVLWYLLVGPVLAVHGAAVAAAAVYAVADLVLSFGFVGVLRRGAGGVNRRPVWLLASAVLPLTASDAFLGYNQAHHSGGSRTSFVQLACILTMTFLMAAAAMDRCRDVGLTARGRPGAVTVASKLPYLAVAGGWTLMVVAASKEQLFPWTGLVSGGLAITGLVMLRQLTVQKANEAAAATDELTGLANRSHFDALLAKTLRRAAQTQSTTAVLLVDMNGFKQVNDTLGHMAGDRLLSTFGRLLRSSIRKVDLAGRLGGDEFAIVLQDVDNVDVVEVVLRRIAAAVIEPVLIDGNAVRASASIGIALSQPGELMPEEILHRADLAMYDAKRDGGQIRWKYWTGPSETINSRALQVERR